MDLMQIGSSFGFPAIMCIMLFRKMEKQEARYINNESKLRQVITDNTVAILELKNQLQKRSENDNGE